MAGTSLSSKRCKHLSSNLCSNRRPRRKTLISAMANTRTSKMQNETCVARLSAKENRRRQLLDRSRKMWSLLNCLPSRAHHLVAKTGYSQGLATKLRSRKAHTPPRLQTQWKKSNCRPLDARTTKWMSRRRWPASFRLSLMLRQKMMMTMMRKRRTKKN